MSRLQFPLWLTFVFFACALTRTQAEEDSVVVFNEVQYHPLSGRSEWIELRNLMGVNVDLSGWQLKGGVNYTFPGGTVIPGRGYLVIAAVPGDASLAGTGALGPYSGQLNNSGDSLRLENINGRVMDLLEYSDAGDWPVAADGSGVTLAKRDQGSGESASGNWTASAETGGSPGKANFAVPGELPVTTSLAVLESAWKYFSGTQAPPSDWKTVAFDDMTWSSGPGILYAGNAKTSGGGAGLAGYWALNETSGTVAANAVQGGVAGQLVNGPLWANDAQRGRVLQFDGANDYVNAGSATIPQMTLTNDFTWSFWANSAQTSGASVVLGNRYSPSGAEWSPREFIKFTPGRLEFHRGEAGEDLDYPDFTANTWTHHTVVKKGSLLTYYKNGASAGSRTITQGLNNPQPLLFGGAGTGEYWQGKLDDVAIWDRALSSAEVSSLAGGSLDPAAIGGAGTLATQLPLGGTTYYFRRAFTFNGNPGRTSLTLRLLVDDGAIVYLNGHEIHRSNLPAGTVSHSTFASTPVGDAALSASFTVPVSALVSGNNVLAVEVHQDSASSPDMIFGLSLTATEQSLPIPGTSPTGVVLNEIAAATDPNFQIELANLSGTAIDLTGYTVVSSSGGSYALPAQTLQAGAYLSLTTAQLGFTPVAGARLFLYRPGSAGVADAQTVTNRLRGRSSQYGNAWLLPAAASFGAANAFSLNTAVIVNEIMYHPRPSAPGGESDEQWIELYNRSSATVDLSGWAFDSGISFVFPAGTTLGAGQYIVVARNEASLRAKYPAATIVGNWSGNLSRGGERLRLVDANGNPVNEVNYADGGRWPETPDGYGPSLELRNPRADNSKAESWAASNEGAKSQWQTFSYSASGASIGNDPTQFNELIFGLLDAGELLIDDISVKEVNAGNRELIQNGDFSSGALTGWRMLGTHRAAQVIDDPSNAGNKVLYVRASGAGEHMHNHAETTLKSGGTLVPLNNTSTYTISFRARWLNGSNQLNTRLYFNRAARTSLLPVPGANGTPGAPNTQLTDNTGPTFDRLTHSPAVPPAGQSATVSVVATDPDDISALTLFYRVNTGGWLTTGMTQEQGVWSGVIPGQSTGAKVQFYVQASDALGVTATFPAAGANSRAMIPWNDGQAILNTGTSKPNNVRIVLPTADSDFLHTNTNVMSNDRLPCTIIYNEQEIYYDCSVRLKGSQRGRNQPVRVGFNIRFPVDRKFLGSHEYIAIDRSGAGNQFSQKEILVKHAINRAGGIPGMYDDLIRVIAPRSQQTGAAILQKSRYNDEWLDNQFPDGSSGQMFEYELIYSPTTTNTGTPEGLKVPEPDTVAGVGVTSLGANKEHYRWHWLIKNNRSSDDYAGIMSVVTAMGQSSGSPSFHTQTKALLDVDQWLRAFAVQTLFGIGDSYSSGSQHNAYFFIRPTDGKAMYFPWDMDFAFNLGATSSPVNSGDLTKLLTDPGNERAYYAHLLDLINTVFNRSYLQPWAQHYTTFLPSEDLTTHLNYVDTRRASVLSAISSAVPQVPYRITTTDGVSFNGSFATIQGDAWVDMFELRLAGASGPLTLIWLDDNTWRAQIPIVPGVNNITIEAYNRQGVLIGTDTVTVNGTGTQIPASAANLVISEIMYNPGLPSTAERAAGFTDPELFEFIEVMNISPNETINLSGLQFTQGITFSFPTLALAPGVRALVVGNQAAFLQRYGTGRTILGQYQAADGGNRLANSGEQLQLLDAGGQVIRDFTYSDDAPWPQSPDGAGVSLVLINPAANPNHAVAANWRASVAVDGSPGTGDSTTFTGLPLGDDNGDGIVNLVAYALGGSLSANLPAVGESSEGFLTIQFRRNLAADDVNYIVERSTDLQTWSSNTADVTLSLEQHNGDGTATYLFRSAHSIDESEREFLRLRIVKP